jgi:hypothetical protein
VPVASTQRQRGGRRRGGRQPGRQEWYTVFDDPAAGTQPAQRTPWNGVWKRLHGVPAPRRQRFLAWRILHAALPVALRAARRVPSGQARQHALCHHTACASAGEHEDIGHVFLSCPVAQRVWGWVGQLWMAITAGPPPPHSAQVTLCGDRAQWTPEGDGLQQLWDILRLATLHHLWEARCKGRQEQQAVTALAIAAQVTEYLRRRMTDDIKRAFSSAQDPYSPVLSSTRLSPEQFWDRWGHRHVLCTPGMGAAKPIIRFRLTHPVPPPLA